MPSPQNYFGLPPEQPQQLYFKGMIRPEMQQLGQIMSQNQAFDQYDVGRAATAQALRAAEFSRTADEQALLVVPMIQQLDPSSENYIQQRSAIESNAPFAAMSTPVRNLFGVKDNQFRNAQYQLRTQMSGRRGAGTGGGGAADRPVTIVEALRAGITVDEIEKLPKGDDGNPHPAALTQAFGQKKSSGTGGGSSKDVTADFYEKRVESAKERVARVEKLLDRNLIKEDDERVMGTFNELETLLKEQEAYLRGKTNPPLPATIRRPAAQSGEAVVPQADNRPLSQKLAGAPVVPPEAFPVPTDKDFVIESGKVTPDGYLTAIRNPNVTQAHREKLLKQFESDLTSDAIPKAYADVEEGLRYKEASKKAFEEAKKEVELAPVRQEWSQAWSKEKAAVDKAITKFATEIGLTPQAVINSLLKDQTIRVKKEIGPGNVVEDMTPIKTLFARSWSKGSGMAANDFLMSGKPEALNKFKGHKFADEIGMGGVLGTGLGAKVVYATVLDKYLEDQRPAQTPQGAPTPAAPPLKIKSIQVVP